MNETTSYKDQKKAIVSQKNDLKPWNGGDVWNNDWQAYLKYLDENNSLSFNYQISGGHYVLRAGCETEGHSV